MFANNVKIIEFSSTLEQLAKMWPRQIRINQVSHKSIPHRPLDYAQLSQRAVQNAY